MVDCAEFVQTGTKRMRELRLREMKSMLEKCDGDEWEKILLDRLVVDNISQHGRSNERQPTPVVDGHWKSRDARMSAQQSPRV